MKKILIYLFFHIFFSNTYSFKFFHNGRVTRGHLNIQRRRGSINEPMKYTRWFTQNLDHFDVENLNTWQQRYFVNEELFDQTKRNVAFLMIEGEEEANDGWMTYGAWFDYAKNYSAILFDIEHRFYGKSRPTDDLSVENLKYLTSEQALADVALFVNAMNDKYNLSSDVKWIAFGGSYAGCLVAWARLKYPHLIHGAVSSSAPVLALPNFKDYYKVVGDNLRISSEDCYTAVKTGTSQIGDFLKDKEGQRKITELFQLCDPVEESVNNTNDISNLYLTLAENFAEMSPLGDIDLISACDIMTNLSDGGNIVQLATINALILQEDNDTCLDINYVKMIEKIQNASYDDPDQDRQWIFQTCNEFGYYMTSDSRPQIFSDKFPLDFWIQQCTDIYGPKFNQTYVNTATNRTNIIYGGIDIEVTNVVFVNGSKDPWHILGVITTQSQEAPAIFINGSTHCADMMSESDDDLPQLKKAREEIGQHIQTWLDL